LNNNGQRNASTSSRVDIRRFPFNKKSAGGIPGASALREHPSSPYPPIAVHLPKLNVR
jgi:hypothetical protein